jgi:Arc/MetJ-type ribon-helix-helix transcriptional regulator
MPLSPRYTVRLPPALDALVQARVRAGTPVAVLIREALSAYLADTSIPTDHTATVQALQAQLAALTQRVEALEQASLRRSQRTDRLRTRAAALLVRLPGGQPKLTPRQITALRAKRARGAPIRALMEEFAISRATLFRYLK